MPAVTPVPAPLLQLRPLLGGHALFHNDDGDVLLVQREGATQWELPGGYSHEHAAATCQRLVRESTGLPFWGGRVLAVNDRPEGDEVAVVLLDFVLDGGLVKPGTEVKLGDEYSAYAWVAPSTVPERVTSSTEWSIRNALDTLRGTAGPGAPYLVGHSPRAIAPAA